jgi:acetyl-CoA acetyltransferase
VSDDVFLVDGVRTPQGRYGGMLASVRPDDLAALVVAEVVSRSGVNGEAIDEVILGVAIRRGKTTVKAVAADWPPCASGSARVWQS